MTLGEPTDELVVQAYVSTMYKQRYSGTGFLYHSRIITTMLEGVKFRDGRTSDKILDTGCGTGFVSQLYPNFDVTGIDISEDMLKLNPHKWLKAPAEAIPFPDDTFDFVICRSLLHHLETPSKGLTEMVRVLKPGGKWVCWEPNLSVFNDWIRKLAKMTRRFSHWHKNFSPKELQSLIRATGLHIQSVAYQGYLAYPLIGFPDIWDTRLPISVGRTLMAIDDLIGKTFIAPIGWATMIKAVK